MPLDNSLLKQRVMVDTSTKPRAWQPQALIQSLDCEVSAIAFDQFMKSDVTDRPLRRIYPDLFGLTRHSVKCRLNVNHETLK